MCPSSKSVCVNTGCVLPGTYPGMERYEFKGLTNIGPTSGIPSSCCNVRFVFDECCRSSSINTGAANQNYYTDALVNRCTVTPCNSAPVFTNDPYMIVCGGEPFIYNPGAIDLDHDSLTYAFAPALQGFNSPVSYDPPFTYNKPMPWTGSATGTFPAGISCDPVSGNVMFTPNNATGSDFYGIICIEVKQWRKISGTPTVIGITRSDITVRLLANCAPNNIPRLTTIPSSGTNPNVPKTDWQICAGQQLCFDIIAKDTDHNLPTVSDTTYLTWNEALTPYGATFTPNYVDSTRTANGPREDNYKFCWTPNDSLASNTPYAFTVKGKDSRCPNVGKLIRAFSIKVLESPDISIQKTYAGCNNWIINYSQPPGSVATVSPVWFVSSEPLNDSSTYGPYTVYPNIQTLPPISFSQPGKYVIRLEAPFPNLCTKVIYDTLTVDTGLLVSVRDTFACFRDTIMVTPKVKNGIGPLVYKWYNSIKDTALPALNAPNFTTPSFRFSADSTRRFTLVVKDSSGCMAIDSFPLFIKTSIVKTILTNISCHGANDGSIKFKQQDSTAIYEYKLNGGTGQTSPSFTNLLPGTYSVSVSEPGGCSRTFNNLIITEPAVLTDSATIGNDESCFNMEDGSISVVVKGGTGPYFYTFDSAAIYSSTNVFGPLYPGTYKVYIKDSKGCKTSISKTIGKADSLSVLISKTNVDCFNANNGSIVINTSGGKQPYLYKLGSAAFGTNNNFTNLATGTYSIQVKDSNGCIKTLSQVITQPTPILASTTQKDVSCFNGNNGEISITTVSGGKAPYSYKLDSAAFGSNNTFTNLVAGTYSVQVKDSNGCIKTLSKVINQPTQLVPSATQKNISCFGSNNGLVTIASTGGTPLYTYQTDSGVFDNNAMRANLSLGLHSFTVKDLKGCSASFTKTITEPAALQKTMNKQAPTCNNRADGNMTITALGGTAPYQYKLNSGSFGTNNAFATLLGGTYTVTIKDSAGCTLSFLDSIINPSPIVAGAVTGDITASKNTLHVYEVTPQAGMNYLWSAQKGTLMSGQSTPAAEIRWDSVGTGSVKVIVYSDATCRDSSNLSVTIGNTGLNELAEQLGLEVFPNPTKNLLNIYVKVLPENATITLYDAQGKLIIEQPLKARQQLNLEDFPQGIYMLKIADWRGSVIKE
jgi:hypothetical protein